MFVSLHCIFLRGGDEGEIEAIMATLGATAAKLPQVTAELLQRTLLARADDAHLIWRLCFDSEQDYRDSLLDPAWQDARAILDRGDVRVESIAYKRGLHGVRKPDIRNGIWRALIVNVIDGTSREKRDQYEKEHAGMAKHVGSIRNWAVSKIVESNGARAWDYIWEQDYDDVEGLLGEYRMHPIHWGVIDRWYEGEHPDHIIDGRLLRTLCPSPESGIAPSRRAGPKESGKPA